MDLSVNKATHRIVVRAIKYIDNKSFPIHVKEENIYQLIKQFARKEMKIYLEEKIVFTNERHGNTHLVQLCHKKHTQSFSIRFPSYSSFEIANELHKHLCGGKSL